MPIIRISEEQVTEARKARDRALKRDAEFRAFEKEQEKPSLGMVLVIDKSGSRDGDKIEMAKSAARSAAELLGRRDQVAVLAFDGDTYVIAEMQPASNKGKISDEISRIEAGGGTTMYPAMEMAFEMLMATTVKLKHEPHPS